MKSIKKLFALVVTLGILIFLASCGSSSGIVANMEYTATTTTIKITTTFAESEEVKKVTAYIKEYSVNSSDEETFKETKNLSFSNDIYTRANPVEFTGLTKNSKYIYKLYVKTDNYTEEIATLEASTSNAGDTEENSIEIGCGLNAPTETIDGHNDHRIVMSLSLLLTQTGGIINDAEAVRKSYPGFFDDIAKLGVIVE